MFDEIYKVIKEAQLTDPLNVQIPKEELTKEELVAAIRQSIIAEQDAIVLYETYINMTSNEQFKEVFKHITKDEKKHLGELQVLLEQLSSDEAEQIEAGREEAKKEMGGEEDTPESNVENELI